MDTNSVLIKYHNRKMLMTLDLNMLVNVLMDAFGDTFVLEFKEMDESEKVRTSENVKGIQAVTERFWVLEDIGNQEYRRRLDLEEKTIREGMK